MTNKSYRICILIDVRAETVSEAYEVVHNAMRLTNQVDAIEGWESADSDWFDESDKPIPTDRIVEARMAYFERRRMVSTTAKEA